MLTGQTANRRKHWKQYKGINTFVYIKFFWSPTTSEMGIQADL
jgi:hypothetical protein